MPSRFQTYWKDLKENQPEKYYERLRINRERIQAVRKERYENKEEHKRYLAKQRDKYLKKKTE